MFFSMVERLRPAPKCFCGDLCLLEDSTSLAPEKTSRLFFSCAHGVCDFFDFVDAPKNDRRYLEHYAKIGYELPLAASPMRAPEQKRLRMTAENQNDHDEHDDDPNPSARFEYVMQRKTDQSALSFCQCGVCLSPMVEPRQTMCAHSFCQFCILQLVEKEMSCPVCRSQLNLDELQEPDETLMALLDDLEVYCVNKSKGCAWTGPRGNLVEHCRGCEHSVARPKINWSSLHYAEAFTIHRLCQCRICNSPIFDAVETPCDHAFCRICIIAFLKNGGSSCPSCGNALSIVKLREGNWTLQVLLNELVVKCPSSNLASTSSASQCQWVGKRIDLESHFITCTKHAVGQVPPPAPEPAQTKEVEQKKSNTLYVFDDVDTE